MTVRQGDRIEFKPEWQDDGDSEGVFIAIENEDGGRFKVVAEMGLPINPVQVVTVEMVSRVMTVVQRPEGFLLASERGNSCLWFDGKGFGSFYTRKVFRSYETALDVLKTTEF